MRLHEITFTPLKGTGLSTVYETLPLEKAERTEALSGMYPHHKVAKIRPLQVLKDRGQYTYWNLSFDHEGPFCRMMASDDAHRVAAKALSNAARCVELALLRQKHEFKSGYMAPDGSLFYIIRIDRTLHIDAVVKLIDEELKRISDRPFKLRTAFVRNKKRTRLVAEFGSRVKVGTVYPIASPYEGDPFTRDCLNYVEVFESPLHCEERWAQAMAEDPSNPLHEAFREGMQEAFGHQRLYYHNVLPSEFVCVPNVPPASEEACATYVAAYTLGKILLTLLLPEGATQKPWRLLYDEGQKPKPIWTLRMRIPSSNPADTSV